VALNKMYALRAFGGLLYLSGAVIMAYNMAMTIAGKVRAEAPLEDAPYDAAADRPLLGQPQSPPLAQPAE
jgi:cytochrome c oxidase cbb3-type subunit 1